MSLSRESDIDRLFDRLANAEGFLVTARRDAQRIEDEALYAAIDSALANVRGASRTLTDLERASHEPAVTPAAARARGS